MFPLARTPTRITRAASRYIEMRYGYARVSSSGQSLEEQTSELLHAGCDLVRSEKESGKSTTDRTELAACLAFLRKDDSLVVTRIDRLARSLRDLLSIVQQIQDKGAHLIVLKQQIDTSTAAGRAFLHMLGLIAEFERELIVERRNAGLAAARKAGRSLGGRKATIDRDSIRNLLGLSPPVSYQEIARRLKIAPASVYRIVNELSEKRQ